MPKDIEPGIPVEDSSKSEGSTKVIKPLSPMDNEEILEVVNESCPGVASSPPSPRVGDLGVAVGVQSKKDLMWPNAEEIPHPHPQGNNHGSRTRTSLKSGAS
jgi:hypothetical protein